MFFILAAIGGLLGQLAGGYISDKKGRLIACYIGLIGLSIGTILMAGHYSLIILAIVMIMISMSWTIGHNGISTTLTDFPDDDRPIIASLNSSVRFISGGIGFYISSFFVEKSFSNTFLCIGLLMFLLIFMLRKVITED